MSGASRAIANPSRREILAQGLAGALPPSLIPAAATIAPLRDLAETRGLLFGSMIRGDQIGKDNNYTRVAARECDLFVCREVHFDYLEPRQGQYEFAQPDADLVWAQAHHMKFRGNSLLWGEHVPAWFPELDGKAAATRAVTDHISRVCRHFAGNMQSWDVVNEPVKIESGRADGLRRTAFLDLVGPEYIEIAFRAAREADPAAILVLNDFGVELDLPDQQQKRDAMLRLLDNLKKRGVPIDVLGIQSHLRTDLMAKFNERVFADFLRQVADRKLAVMLSELDVGDRFAPADVTRRDAEVAAAYRRYLDVALASRAVTAVISWGLTDRDNWVNSPHNPDRRTDGLPARPLLFDADYVPKPAYFAVAEALQAAPRR